MNLNATTNIYQTPISRTHLSTNKIQQTYIILILEKSSKWKTKSNEMLFLLWTEYIVCALWATEVQIVLIIISPVFMQSSDVTVFLLEYAYLVPTYRDTVYCKISVHFNGNGVFPIRSSCSYRDDELSMGESKKRHQSHEIKASGIFSFKGNNLLQFSFCHKFMLIFSPII